MENKTSARQTAKALSDDTLRSAIDSVSLEQALRDFDIANARVIDLTRRLIASEHQVVTLQREVDEAAQTLRELQTLHHEMRTSAAFRIASKIWNMRNTLGV